MMVVEVLGTSFIVVNDELYSKGELCLAWLSMGNDAFCRRYGFNFNPHEYPGLYEWGRKTLYGEEV